MQHGKMKQNHFQKSKKVATLGIQWYVLTAFEIKSAYQGFPGGSDGEEST